MEPQEALKVREDFPPKSRDLKHLLGDALKGDFPTRMIRWCFL